MSKIFISHSSANNAEALAVAQWLEENGWGDYFLDITPTRGLAPDERWQKALKRAADRCEVVLFLISPSWLESRWSFAEFHLAKLLGKTIFGILVEDTPIETLPKEMTAEWQLCDLIDGADRRVFRVYADAVPDTDITFAEAGLTRLKIGLLKVGINPSTFMWPPPNEPGRAPYRGLKALEAEDAAVFFGREPDIVRGLDTLRVMQARGTEQMLLILGASGAGKSSFLQAGLLPRLKRDSLHFLPLPVIRPERAVISGATGLVASLEAAFRERKMARSRTDIRKALEEPGGLDRVVLELQLLAQKVLGPAAPTVVIPIDQGEELFDAEGRIEADAFMSMLGQTLGHSVTEAKHASAFALITIRSDSYERLQTEPRLGTIKQVLFDLRPLAREELKSVIEGPARRTTDAGRKLTIEPALTEQLLKDAEGASVLPLLAFTLERLFLQCGGDGDLRLDEYLMLGGVRGSIEMAVKAAFADPERNPVITTDETVREHLLHQGFVPWLAGVDPETEKPKRRVARWCEIPPDARPLLERLVEAGLIIRDLRHLEGETDKSVTVEVAHEALLRQWPTLAIWLDEDAEALKTVEAIRRAEVEWRRHGRSEDWLVHTGNRLDTAEALHQRPDIHQLLGDDGRNYLAACRTKEEAVQAERELMERMLADQTEWKRTEREETERIRFTFSKVLGSFGLESLQRKLQQQLELKAKAEKELGELQKDEEEIQKRMAMLEQRLREAQVQLDKSTPNVFISYAKEDYAMASRLFGKFKEIGFRPWLDKENILAGQNWRLAIQQAIEKADFIVICLSKHSVSKKGFVQREIKWALDIQQEVPMGKVLTIPVRLEACDVPVEIKNYQYVDLYEPEGMSNLLTSILTHWSEKRTGKSCRDHTHPFNRSR